MDEKLFFNLLIIGWLALSAIVFISLFFISAPYGRYSRKGWGFSINNRISWLIMEAPAAITILVFYFLGDHRASLVSVVFLLMWEAHYIHRAFFYPFSLPKSARLMPVSIIAFGFFFNLVNGYLNGRYLFTFSYEYPLSWFYDPRFIIGVIMFIGGYLINRNSDHILKSLRGDNNAGEYKIPSGGLFDLVSSPNYFGEIIIWTGWAIATWSPSGFVFAFWTAANLVPRARANHRWYHDSFTDYPETRKALIPKIW
jgi:3-oxo-5-alpha-steroid 4-dehydrogenase 1